MILTLCPVILPGAALSELAMLPEGVQILASHVNVLNWPFVPQVAVPPPEYPVLHVTVTVLLVVPTKQNREKIVKYVQKSWWEQS